jgi:hypothetical protein
MIVLPSSASLTLQADYYAQHTVASDECVSALLYLDESASALAGPREDRHPFNFGPKYS